MDAETKIATYLAQYRYDKAIASRQLAKTTLKVAAQEGAKYRLFYERVKEQSDILDSLIEQCNTQIKILKA